MAEELFYIQHRGYVGNCLIWWAHDGHGYTVNLDHAWKVSKARAENICAMRSTGEDIMRKAAVVDALSVRHLDIESVRSEGVDWCS